MVLVDDVLFTGRTVARRDRRPVRLRAPRSGSSSRSSSTAATASCRSAPTTSARTCRPRATERVYVRVEELDGVDEVAIGRSAVGGASAMRHLLSIADLERADIERIMERAEGFAEVGRRDIKKVPTLRGRTIVNLFYESSTRTSSSFELAAKRLSADVVSVKSQRLLGGQGRVAQGHDRHAQRLRAGGDRDPLPARRRRRSRRRAGPTRRSSTPATASTSTRARRCSTSTRCGAGSARWRASGSGSSATSSTAASPARTSSPFA